MLCKEGNVDLNNAMFDTYRHISKRDHAWCMADATKMNDIELFIQVV